VGGPGGVNGGGGEQKSAVVIRPAIVSVQILDPDVDWTAWTAWADQWRRCRIVSTARISLESVNRTRACVATKETARRIKKGPGQSGPKVDWTRTAASAAIRRSMGKEKR
jgi:hypothetical protein